MTERVRGLAGNSLEEQLEPYQIDFPENAAPITNGDEYENAAHVLREIKAVEKEVDALRKTALAPVEQEKRQIEGLFSPIRNGLLRYETAVKREMGAYTKRIEEEKRALEKRLRDENPKQGPDGDRKRPAFVPLVVSDVPKVTGISTRKTWKAEVTDFPSFIQWVLDNGQFQLIDVNYAELNALARQQRSGGNVPGVQFKEEDTLVARS